MTPTRSSLATAMLLGAALLTTHCTSETATCACTGNEECVGGRCLSPCTDAMDCASGFLCFEGYCEEGTQAPGDANAPAGDSPQGDPGPGDPGPGDPGQGDTFMGDPNVPPEDCGNGTQQPGELCDTNDVGATLCTDFDYTGGSVTCQPSCQHYDLSACTGSRGSCGNGNIQGPEQCDGGALNGESCISLGYDEGTLDCSGTCFFDVSDCDFD